MELKPATIIAGTAATITAVLSIFGGVIAFDARYTKQTEFVIALEEVQTSINEVKTDIIDEMRREVVKNRTVMINAMQREADDLDWQMLELTTAGKSVPRYMSEKHTLIKRQIEALKDDEDSTD